MIIRLFKFGLIKVLGAIIFLSLLYFMVDILRVGKIIAQLILIIITFFSKFTLNSLVTWGDRRAKSKQEILRRIILYALVGILLSVMNFFIYYFLIESGTHYLTSAIISGVIVSTIGYFLCDFYIWKK